MLLTLGVLIAAGIALIQIKSVFYGEQDISKQEVINQFANDIDSIIDKCSSTTGNTSFDYNPSIKKYKLEVKDNVITIQDRLTNKTVQFVKTNINLKDTTVIDSRTIHVSKNKDNVFIIGRCLEAGEECSSSFVCCNKYCWGDSIFICQNQCADNGVRAADDESCCSGFLNKTTGLCDVPPFCPTNRVCHGAPEAEIIGGEDCCPMDKPICTGGHCCPSDKPKWCNNPTNGEPRCMSDDEFKEECNSFCPADTPCKEGWPSHKGSIVSFNENNRACDIFEVCDEDLDYIIEEATLCCENACSGNCHSACQIAYSYSGMSSGYSEEKLKKCKGLYLIYGLGPGAKFMKGYFWNEICCAGIKYCLRCPCTQSELGKCSCGGLRYKEHVDKLKCKCCVGRPCGWASDTDMTKNSCMFSDLPAHANILETKGIHTGVCIDYSISLTTLLRKAGYEKNEVYTVSGPGHAFNLVKFPGDTKWHLIDTTHNKPPYTPGSTPPGYYPYCRYNSYSCANDFGQGPCPSKSEVYGC